MRDTLTTQRPGSSIASKEAGFAKVELGAKRFLPTTKAWMSSIARRSASTMPNVSIGSIHTIREYADCLTRPAVKAGCKGLSTLVWTGDIAKTFQVFQNYIVFHWQFNFNFFAGTDATNALKQRCIKINQVTEQLSGEIQTIKKRMDRFECHERCFKTEWCNAFNYRHPMICTLVENPGKLIEDKKYVTGPRSC